ncbi:MAG: ankyrin repeat domain-containing protein, partial [Sandaracinaceae bacterium]
MSGAMSRLMSRAMSRALPISLLCLLTACAGASSTSGPVPSSAAPVAASSRPERTPLFEAAARGQLDRVRALLAEGASPDEAVRHGLTPLIISGYAGHVAVVRALLEAGADPNLPNDDGEHALITCAASPAANEIVPILLQAGAAHGHVDQHGRQALAVQAQEGHHGAV